jgi:hypothetical protein
MRDIDKIWTNKVYWGEDLDLLKISMVGTQNHTVDPEG